LNCCDDKRVNNLKNIDDKIIIASLKTRDNKAPSLITVNHGCNIDATRNFNCYCFSPDISICTNQFTFPIQTFIYENEVEDYVGQNLNLNHKIKGVDYEICGQLNTHEYNEIINCFKLSKSIRIGVNKLL
jgi:hypothetical protein